MIRQPLRKAAVRKTDIIEQASSIASMQQVMQLIEDLKKIKADHQQSLKDAQDEQRAAFNELRSKLSKDGQKALETASQYLIDEAIKKFKGIFADLDAKIQDAVKTAEQVKQMQKGDPGKDGTTPKVGIDYFTEKEKGAFLDEIAKRIKPPKDGEPGKDAILTREVLLDMVSKMPKGKRIKMEHIDGLDQTLSVLRNFMANGGVRGGGDIVQVKDLTALTDGVTKTFTLPKNSKVLHVMCTDAPIIYRPTTDYTTTSTSITFTAAVNAPSTGATLIVSYVP